MNDNTNKRIDFVDLTKGICIILVVMAHIDGAFAKFDESSMISCFRMPLYFFISGIFFKSYEGFAGFLIRKINKLLIPFTFFYITAFLLKYVVWKIAPGVFHLPVQWSEMLVIFHGHDLIKFNPPIWFLIALFNCNILFYLIHFLRNKHLNLMFTSTLLIGAVNAECDDRITSEIGYYGDVLDPFAEKHDHKDAGKRGYIELSDISCIAVGAHSGGGSGKIIRTCMRTYRDQIISRVSGH